MSLRIHKKGRVETGVVNLRNTLSSTIQGITIDCSAGGTVIIHLDPRMKDIASSIFEQDGFRPLNQGVDKILLSCPNNDELNRFLDAFEKIEPLDDASKKLLQETLCNLCKLLNSIDKS